MSREDLLSRKAVVYIRAPEKRKYAQVITNKGA